MKARTHIIQIYNLYSDNYNYIDFVETIENLIISTLFIINKYGSSSIDTIATVGSTLFDFFNEIMSVFSNDNIYKFKNAA